MIANLILAIIIGLGVAYFAIQNTYGVTVTLANIPLTGIPLYMVVIASLLIGLLVAFIFTMLESIGTFFTLRGKEGSIAQKDTIITHLRREIKNLEVENTKLKEQRTHAVQTPASRYSFMDRIRHSF